jgi:glycosyltransferase involved in cell wall biosynthesis
MDGETPVRVSIVVPAFNAERWIADAIGSALAQTEPALEVLVVDDASTDRTPDIAAGAAAGDPRVRIMRLDRNSGPAAARNRAIAEARGTWIALLDADDRFHPDRLRRLLTLAQTHHADMVADNLLLCSEGGAAAGVLIPTSRLPAPQLLSARAFIAGNISSRHAQRSSLGFLQPMVRRAFLDSHALRYDERNRFGEDFLLYLRCLLHGAAWWITPEPTYLYTVRRHSLTNLQSAADLARIRMTERALLTDPRIVADRPLWQALRRHKRTIDRNFSYRAFTDAIKAGYFGRACAILFESGNSPFDIARETGAHLPLIAAKALRGGYR